MSGSENSDTITIGIIGDGQLGKMLIDSAAREKDNNSDDTNNNITPKVRFNVLSPNPENIYSRLSKQYPNVNIIPGSFHFPGSLRQLVRESDVTTYELENINVDELLNLQSHYDSLENKQYVGSSGKIIPPPHVLAIIRDKGVQKQFYLQHQIPTSRFQIVKYPAVESGTNSSLLPHSFYHLAEFLRKQPFFADNPGKIVLKSCRGGYDGLGVLVVDVAELDQDYDKAREIFKILAEWDDILIEEFIPFQKELAIIIAADQAGNTTCYTPVEMVFNEDNKLQYQLCPPNFATDKQREEITQTMETIARKILKGFAARLDSNCPKIPPGGIPSGEIPAGIFAIEMFLTRTGEILVNEMAPRPHNSGHHTIEAAATSQFAQLLRILTGQSLGPTNLVGDNCSLMFNLLGPRNHTGDYIFNPAVEQFLQSYSDNIKFYVHLYGKYPSKPGRKLGHLTIIANGKSGDEYFPEIAENLKKFELLLPK